MYTPRRQVTIPYLDPALPFQTRQDALRVNYGFECACSLCAFGRCVEPVPNPPSQGSAELRAVEDALRTFSLGDVSQGQGMQVPAAPGAFERLPRELHCVLHESYLPSLSESFSKASHEGPYGDAVEQGLTLLAFYAMIYPPNYPQIGKFCARRSRRPREFSLASIMADMPLAQECTHWSWRRLSGT